MSNEQRKVKIYRVTLKQIIQRLMNLKKIDINNFKNEVLKQFEGYDYEDVEDVVGFDTWEDISNDGKYQLMAKIDHQDAYEFSIFIEVKDKKVSIYNVL